MLTKFETLQVCQITIRRMNISYCIRRQLFLNIKHSFLEKTIGRAYVVIAITILREIVGDGKWKKEKG